MGDFNYPHINWDTWMTIGSHTSSDYKFVEAMKNCFLFQHVTQPTRYRYDQTPNVLDLIFTNEENMVTDLKVLAPLGKSDHGVLSFTLHCYIETDITEVSRRQYNKGDYDQLRCNLNIDWEAVLAPFDGDPETQLKLFNKIVEKEVDTCIPSYKFRLGSNLRKIPVNAEFRRLNRRKRRLWTRYMESKDRTKYLEYCKFRNKVRALSRKNQREFERLIASKVRDEPKLFWNYAKSKLKTTERIPDLYSPDGAKVLVTNDVDKANVLSDFFASVFTQEPNTEFPDVASVTIEHPMTQLDINKENVQKVLQNLRSTKSPGPDGIHPHVLKELSTTLSTPLALIFKSSLASGTVPMSWKAANISPIFKKGDKRDPSNYRPISLTSVACKVLEKLIRDHLMEYLKKNNLLSNKQYGFVSGRSVSLQLITVMNDWTRMLDSGQSVDVIYLDFMKAFDKVPHRRLIHKLKNLEVHSQITQWMENFLTGRTQTVVYNGHCSAAKDVNSGIPQGTVIGPASFLTFINDLPDNIITYISIC